MVIANIWQGVIISIFSAAVVVFLPLTMVAKSRSMIFDVMPELKWTLGYPWMVGLMILSVVLSYLWFKRWGWL